MNRFALCIILALLCIPAGMSALYADQPTVGILSFTPKGASQSDAEAVRELVINELVKTGRLNILDRDNTKFVMAEQEFQQSGFTDQEYAVKVGKLLDAQFMVYGSLMKLGTEYMITVNMVSIETSEVVNSSEKQFKDISQMRSAVKSAIYGIAMMQRKTGEKWSAGKGVVFGVGVAGVIGTVVTGILGYSKYNTATGMEIDNTANDPEITKEIKQTRSSASILATVAGVTVVISAALLIWSYFLPKDPVYKDIPWSGKVKKPQTPPAPKVSETEGDRLVPVSSAAPVIPATSDTVTVQKDIQPVGATPAVADSPMVQKPLSRTDVTQSEDTPNDEGAQPQPVIVETKPVSNQQKPEYSSASHSPKTDRNRSGIHLQGVTLWGDPWFYLNGVEAKPVKNNTTGYGYTDMAKFSSGPLVRINFDFLIKVGPYINIGVGPVGQWQNMNILFHSEATSEHAKIEFTNGLVGISQGVSYVYRRYPLKINAGIYADLGFGWLASTLSATDASGNTLYGSSSFGSYDYQETNWANAFGWGAGVRAGAEYLFSQNFGANLDLMFRFSRSQYTPNSPWSLFGPDLTEDTHIKYLLGYQNSDHPTIEIIPPMFGFGVGVSIYY